MPVFLDTSEVHHLAADLFDRSVDIEDEVSDAVALTAYSIESGAQATAPVDTGNLKNSIGADPDGLEATVTAGAKYADYVERGTSRMRAQPFLGPAFDANFPDFVSAVGQMGARL